MVKGLQAHLSAHSQWLFSFSREVRCEYLKFLCRLRIISSTFYIIHVDGRWMDRWFGNPTWLVVVLALSIRYPPNKHATHSDSCFRHVAPDLDPLCNWWNLKQKGYLHKFCCIKHMLQAATQQDMMLYRGLVAVLIQACRVQHHVNLGLFESYWCSARTLSYRMSWRQRCHHTISNGLCMFIWEPKSVNTSFQFWLLPLSQQCSNCVRTLGGGKHHATTMTHLVAASFGSA